MMTRLPVPAFCLVADGQGSTFFRGSKMNSQANCIRALLLAAVTGCAWTQSINSEILGVVTDQSGASVVGARVRATNKETNIFKDAVSANDGRFRINLLSPGS